MTGALVGRLGSWLPASREEVAPRIDDLMALVALLARSPQDEPWWYAMTTLGRNAAAVSVAAAFADAASRGPSPRQLSLLLTDQVMGGLLDQALAAARRFTLQHEVPPAVEGGRGPQASPAQQARAAAERAAAEREETQRAFMERNAARVARGATPPLGISQPPAERSANHYVDVQLVEAFIPRQTTPEEVDSVRVAPDDVVEVVPEDAAGEAPAVVAVPDEPQLATPLPGAQRTARSGGRGKGRRVPTPTDGARAQVPSVTPSPLSAEGTGSSVWQTLMRPR